MAGDPHVEKIFVWRRLTPELSRTAARNGGVVHVTMQPSREAVAAAELVKRVFGHVEQLVDHPDSGSRPQELGRSRYRQIVEPPCRIFYRHDGHKVFIVHVMRSERLLRKGQLTSRSKQAKT